MTLQPGVFAGDCLVVTSITFPQRGKGAKESGERNPILRGMHGSMNLKTIILIWLLTIAGMAQSPHVSTRFLITDTRVVPIEGSFTGRLYVKVAGKEKLVAREIINAWIIREGRQVVYSGLDGSGGFENEGQSLWIYDERTRKRRKILSEYYGVNKVKEVTTSRNRTALLVEMADGGLGAKYFAIVDPDRGEVFFRRWAVLMSQDGDTITLGFYKEDDWDKLDSDANAKVTPYKTERHNLNSVLRQRVIVNKRDR